MPDSGVEFHIWWVIGVIRWDHNVNSKLATVVWGVSLILDQLLQVMGNKLQGLLSDLSNGTSLHQPLLSSCLLTRFIFRIIRG